MIGQTVSHYKILEKLGEGGMGVVYHAEDTKLKRSVALKFLPPTLLVNEDDRHRFVHEAQASAALSHPNIATVFEIDESEKQTFIALEYIEGQSLAEKIKSGPLKLDEALSITIQTCEGLQAAHEKGIVHRDVKSHNIMVTTKGQVKILDFGLAKLRGASVVTKKGTTVGTMGYMSPEQLRGDAVDQRTDIWAIGVVLYEMIAGRRPFQGDYEDAVSYQIINQQPEPLTAIRTGVPMELERLVNKLLSKNVAERYQSTTDLLVDLRALKKASDSGITQVKPSSSISNRRRILMSAGMILLLSTIGSLYYLFAPKSYGQIRSLAVLPFENMSKDTEQEYFADAMTDQLITELSKVHSLHVISFKSAMVFKNRHELLPTIGRTLNVEGLITATVLRFGDRVRVNAQLIRASDEENLWSESYDQKLEGVLDLQASLARSITQRISVALTPDEKSRLSKTRPVNPEAFDLVARGNYLLMRAADDAEFRKTYELMKKAVDIDSMYADAQVGLALSVVHRKFMGFTVPPAMITEAHRAIDKALELNPSSGRALSTLGQLYWVEGNIPECIRKNKKAVELDSSDGFILTNYSWMLMLEGNYDEGIRQAEKAVALDPLSQYARCNLMGWYYTVHRNRDAETQARRNLEIDSSWEPAVNQLALITEHEGRYEEARQWWLKDFQRLGLDTRSFPSSGSWQEFRLWRTKAFERANLREYLVYSLLFEGDKERAMATLTNCVEQKSSIVLCLFYPDFDMLRDDPRFEALAAKAELPLAAYCTLPKKK
jgi:serine/threonine protein kinase